MAAKRKRASRSSEAIERRIVSVDDSDEYVNILIYGRNGMGKTRFAGSGPKCLICDVREEGTRSVKGTGSKKFPVNTWNDIGDIFWYLKSGNHDYESVAIDTITALNALCLKHVMGQAEDRDPSRETGLADQRTYGRAGNLMREILLEFRGLPMHVIFLAQERVIKDEDTDEPILHTPDLPAGSRGTAMGCVSFIGRIYSQQVRIRNKSTRKITEKWEDRLLIGPHEEYDTKDRTNSLGQVVRNPTMTKLIEANNS